MGLRVRIGSRGEEPGKPAGPVGKLFGSLFFLVFFGMGLFFLVMLVGEVWKQVGPRFWTETPCRMLESDVVPNEKRSPKPYLLKVRYAYEAGGREHVGDVYRVGESAFKSRAEAEELAERHGAGVEAVCYVDPNDPSKAVLAHGIPWIGLMIFLPLIFVLVGAVGVYAMWKTGSKPKENRSISAGARSGKGVGCLVFTIFLITGATGTFFLLVAPLGRVLDARNWIATPCTIISSEVGYHRGEDSATYSIDIYYRYEFDGREYRTDRYDFMGGSSSGRERKARVVRDFPAGSTQTCWVNADRPDEAVLNRDFRPVMLFGLIPLVFVVIGAIGLLGGFGGGGRVRGPGMTEPDLGGPVALKRKVSPLGKLIGMLVFCLFWNGIISIFLFAVVQGWMKGDGSIFMTLFMLPFVLIGLGTLAGVVYFILALFNPEPRLKLESGRIAIGESASVDWTIGGNVRRIRKLTLTLEGQEQATYRRGTTTRTDRSLFHREVLLETEDHRDMSFGQVKLTIPQQTMHTWKASNNRIDWALRVHGDIHRWPDVDEEFAITVEPARTGGSR
jgi:hypothetical protein